ncbi:uncharacterized protein LOC125579744 [Brassica napus]|uniref:uncharacterized protein LOC125579744 n=1 Tax=Brassica napus TaxID=3708 RepID=UPI002078FAC4|nr:uncharacterized protein LOC125579744 [Brassica napus]
MLKLRSIAKTFYKRELGNGRQTSFWFDNWSEKGVLSEVLGDRGIIDMGVAKYATVEEAVLNTRRRKRHRTSILKDMEAELSVIVSNLRSEEEDVSLWRRKSGYRKTFSTQETWLLLRVSKVYCDWSRGIWMKQATPKYAFMAWLAARDRLSTLDRIAKWSQGTVTTCVLCNLGT